MLVYPVIVLARDRLSLLDDSSIEEANVAALGAASYLLENAITSTAEVCSPKPGAWKNSVDIYH